ncbi:MAG: UTP--glucose-1-phosphate uridylyltransferase [Planctomycetota bacterium]|jgi:UDP-N-acetylglucosamine/UDP-N-acetylgalactosamine diphosphorylase
MSVEKKIEKLSQALENHDQSQLFAFLSELNRTQMEKLIARIDELDFSKIDEWVSKYVLKPAFSALSGDIIPADSYPSIPAGAELKEKYEQARELGEKLISQGKVAPFLVAGGEGTRLGYDGPKGNFPASPVKNKTLFQIFAETIKAVSEKNKVHCPWYIMTSSLNYAQTTEIFSSNNYYGLPEDDIFIFQQGTMPNFDLNGKILLADKDTISCSPDGHGGSLKALYKSGAIEDMRKRGVEYISYYQVDNPLINIFDPLFIGLHVLDKAEMSSKALIKSGPMEKVGNFCLVDGRVTVIEYSDLPDELAYKKNTGGSLAFELGSIAIHIINTDFVEKLNKGGFSLPIHRALKKIPFINKHGKIVEPAEPNGIKLETFVFDALPLASRSIILQTIREQEFAPIKNATGVDSALTSSEMIIARSADWLEAAGVKVPRKEDGSPDCIIEIAPGFALEKEDVKQKLDRIPRIKRGDIVYLE